MELMLLGAGVEDGGAGVDVGGVDAAAGVAEAEANFLSLFGRLGRDGQENLSGTLHG